jgi:hypothetical protein
VQGVHPVADRLPHLLEVRDVEADPPRLHPREDRCERQLHLLEQRPEALPVDLLLQDRREEGHGRGLRCHVSPGIL